ncbi:F0F1 ATP synthase subunit B [Hespellia stercorisuis]|uniref:ATP synthase subunit b n=1 Tax=Hespellia stercorisuis DSM 15480 TaxID=1121950 RepID=A0A1M6J0J2_9FIRM|nr:F0F1 ATP synthase subunit B [Hespellia stercorisuis]SHJ40205.1 ATP synthase F0 subcomplex B subunit [Hespellia stercorisuis DSM 15480]
MLSLNWNLLFTIINLIVLYLLMKKFLIGPVTGIMEKRKALIEDGLANADKANKDAQKMKQQYEDSLQNARQESERIMTTAKAEAKNEYNRIVEEAGEKAGKLLSGAQATIEAERAQTVKELQTEIAGLAMTAAKKIVNESGNDAVYDLFLSDVNAGDSTKSNGLEGDGSEDSDHR